MDENQEADHIVAAGIASQAANCLLDAEMTFRAVLSKWPEHPPAAFHLAMVVAELGNKAEADALFRSAWQKAPSRVDYLAEWKRFALQAFSSEYVIAVLLE